MRSKRRSRLRSWLTTSAPPRQRSSSSATAARPSASRLLVGSSMTMKSGSAINSAASAARVAWPPLKVVRRAIERGARQAHLDQRGVDALRQRPVGRLEVARPALAGFQPGEPRQRLGDTQQVGERRAGRRRVLLAQRRDAAGHGDRAGGGRRLAEDQAQQRRLADAVAADEAGPLAPEREGQVFEEDAAVRAGLGEGVEGDEGHGRKWNGGRTERRSGSSAYPWRRKPPPSGKDRRRGVHAQTRTPLTTFASSGPAIGARSESRERAASAATSWGPRDQRRSSPCPPPIRSSFPACRSSASSPCSALPTPRSPSPARCASPPPPMAAIPAA